MKSVVTTLLILGIALGGSPADADCESDCYQDYVECYLFNPACEDDDFCVVCEDEYQWCLDGCQPPACTTDTCSTCSQPAAGVDQDGDGVPDRLEYDLAHQYFPNLLLAHFTEDLNETYPYRGLAMPYTVEPRTTGICNEDRECLEIRYGTAYRYDWGDDFWGHSHLGDSEFYAALVMRTTSWSTASTSASYWQLIRDFTAAHWGTLVDSSRYGAYGYCPPYCHQWDNDQQACYSESQCGWFPGLCYGVPSQPWDNCSYYWQEGDCYFAGCQWQDSSCFPPSRLNCYASSPVSSPRILYSAEGKHALYHTDSECDGGGFLSSDNCPNNQYNLRSYKSGKLQNIGRYSNHGAFDTLIQHPDLCALYDVWGGAGFAASTAYRDHFLSSFSWGLPASAPMSASSHSFSSSTARDRYLTCHGMAGRISSNCRDISALDDQQRCYANSETIRSYCTQIIGRHLQLACHGMSTNWSPSCRDITDPTMMDFCNGVSGSNRRDCNNITDADTRLLCLALATDNASHCSGIRSGEDRRFCSGVASPDSSYCAGIR